MVEDDVDEVDEVEERCARPDGAKQRRGLAHVQRAAVALGRWGV